MFQTKRTMRFAVLVEALLLIGLIALWGLRGSVWTSLDFQLLDGFFRKAIADGHGPEAHRDIVYIKLTDDFYEYLGGNTLDRIALARVNDTLSRYQPKVVAYDIVFARPSNSAADDRFAHSIRRLGNVYLPIATNLGQDQNDFGWGQGEAYDRLESSLIRASYELGQAKPFYATKAVLQRDSFATAARGMGHIGIKSDSDGVYRHMPIVIKLDTGYVPAFVLAIFLQESEVPFDNIRIHWGREVVIPATASNRLDQDVVIPIDNRGRTFIPYVNFWNLDFDNMGGQSLLKYAESEDFQGALTDFFEGKYVFIGDISVGATDIGNTPLDRSTSLLVTHPSLLNAMLQNTFYRPWSSWGAIGIIVFIALLLTASALFRPIGVIYGVGVLIAIFLVALTWFQVTAFALVPIASIGASFLLLFVGLVIGLPLRTFKEKEAFILDAFGKYAREEVVNALLAKPELLKLGGEERTMTVLFSDIEGFTTLSENMKTTMLVTWLNEFFSEMTHIIQAEGGLIDHYAGDGILAEFGAPLHAPDHADQAVRAALAMQRKLHELNEGWRQSGKPQIKYRIGINTGDMVVGNLGSEKVFHYTVIGDAVNLGARLEGENKNYQTYLMISQSTYEHLTPGAFHSRVLDVIKVKGRNQAVKVYEVYDPETATPDDLAYYQAYHLAFEAYLDRRFDDARKGFGDALTCRPRDLAADKMMVRIDAIDPAALPDNWDGYVSRL